MSLHDFCIWRKLKHCRLDSMMKLDCFIRTDPVDEKSERTKIANIEKNPFYL